MGAAAGAIIAARQRRMNELIDAFRLADATSVDRAKSLVTIGLAHDSELQALIVEGVVMPGAQEGTYYLSEIGYIYRRDDRRGLRAILIVMAVLLLLGIVLIPLAMVRS